MKEKLKDAYHDAGHRPRNTDKRKRKMNTGGTYNGNRTDLICKYCGRPVLKDIVWGNAGAYHRECTEPPKTLMQDIMKLHQPPNFTYPAPIPYQYEPKTWTSCETPNP
jgi:hypothetical protein